MDSPSLRESVELLRRDSDLIIERFQAFEHADKQFSEIREAYLHFFELLGEAVSLYEKKETETLQAYALLRQFAEIDHTNPKVLSALQEHVAVAKSLLDKNTAVLSDEAQPYLLFIRLIQDTKLELTTEDEDSLIEVFGTRLTTPLFRGQYTIKPNDSETHLAPISVALAAHPTAEPAEDEPGPIAEEQGETEQFHDNYVEPPADDFTVIVEKTQSAFSPKAFASDYLSTAFSGKRRKTNQQLNPSRIGDIGLLHVFARLGGITLEQLDRFCLGEYMTAAHHERLIKNGYLAKIVHSKTGKTFYALSPKGYQVFLKEKSLAVIKRLKDVPTHILEADHALAQLRRNPEEYERLTAVALFISDLEMGDCEVLTMERNSASDDKAGLRIDICFEDFPAEITSLHLVSRDAVTQDVLIYVMPAKSYLEQKAAIINAQEFTFTHRIICTVDIASLSLEFADEDGSLAIDDLIAKLRPDDTSGFSAEDAKNAEAELAAVKPKEETATQLALLMLQDEKLKPGMAEFNNLIARLLEDAAEAGKSSIDHFGRAATLLQALAMTDAGSYLGDYYRLLYATGLPGEGKAYSGAALQEYFAGSYEGSALHLASLLQALFAPDQKYDYTLYEYAKSIFEHYEEHFAELPELKQLLNTFLGIQNDLDDGFSEDVIGRTQGSQAKREAANRITKEAAKLIVTPRLKSHLNGLPQMLADCFGPTSLLGECINIIAAAKIAERGQVADLYHLFVEQSGRISDEKISEMIVENWKSVRTKSGTPRRLVKDLLGVVRNRLNSLIRERLELMGRWLLYTGENEGGNILSERRISAIVLKELAAALSALRGNKNLRAADRAILVRALTNMIARLKMAPEVGFKTEDWLSGGWLAYAADAPIVSIGLAQVKYYEPWRQVLCHIAAEPQDLHTVLDRIDSFGDPLYDNLGQAIAICEFLGDEARAEQYRESIVNASKTADSSVLTFLGKVELDFAYGRISEQTKETVLGTLETHRQDFFESCDFARLRSFLAALTKQLDDDIAANRSRWAAAIAARRGKRNEEALDQIEKMLVDDKANFVLIEEALNKFDRNIGIEEETLISDDEDFFKEFIDEAYFNPLYRFCHSNKGYAFRNFAARYADNALEKANRSMTYRRSAQRLIEHLPNTPQDLGVTDIKSVLEELGFTVKGVQRQNPNQNPSRFTVRLQPDLKNRAYYDHPIAEMGTRLPEELTVVEMFGNWEPVSIVSEISRLDCPHMPLVFLDGSLTLEQRRQLARIFLKDRQAQNPFILIDWVLLLHLAKKAREERLSVLLSCALPYTGTKQLFSMNSTQAVADELYIGRTQEVSQILDVNGPVIVYGGRQLGKTALLFRAMNRFHDEARQQYGVYIDLRNRSDEASLTEQLCRELNAKNIPIGQVSSISDVREELQKWLRAERRRRLLLLFDESDNLLANLAADKYAALTPLESLGLTSDGRFRFVFAGLHNVFLAAQDANTIFGHFGNPLCIKPMSQADAYRLISKPLRYLGFAPDPDMLLRLLVNTNYYPGIVHFVGAKLIEMLTSRYADYYSEKSNPPYLLTDQQIGAIMNSADLTNMIAERINWTLNADPAYAMLARCIALLCYYEEEKRSYGYDLDTIFDFAIELGFDTLRSAGKNACLSLLMELCEMSILIEIDGSFRFRQLRFLNIVGRSFDDIMAQIAAGGLEDHEP